MKSRRAGTFQLSLATLGDGCRIAYRLDGPDDGPVLLLSSSLGCDLGMWAPQLEAFTRQYRVLRYDSRGHGRSDAPAGAYSIERLGFDVIELLDVLHLARVSFCGVSLGGMIGQWLGVFAPERIERLVLANTAPSMGPRSMWQERIEAVSRSGMSAVAEASIERWFTPGLFERAPERIAPMREMLLATPPAGYAGCCAAIRDLDLRKTAAQIAPDTLLIAGAFDRATPPERSEEIARAMAKPPQLVELDGAHLCNVELPEAFTRAVLDFLAAGASAPSAARASRRAPQPVRPVRVERVETLLVDVPTIRPHRLSMTTMRRQTLVLVRVRCSDGVIGVGEGTTIGGLSYGEESPEGIKLAVDTYLAPALGGCDPQNVSLAMAEIDRLVRGNHFAKCAVETALLDACGRRLGLPLAELLGGRMRDRLPVAWTLASGDTSKDIEEAEQMLDRRRHRVFKLKIGARALNDDVMHVAAIKRALGDRASVRVDVNQAWDEPTAMRGMAALEDAGVDLVEQPVSRSNPRALRRLAARFLVPVMADEALHGPEDAFELARSAAADVFAIKLAPSGGVHAAARVAAVAGAAGIGLYGGTMLEGGVGTAAAAHLFSTVPALAWGTELFGPLLLTEELLVEPLAYSEFAVTVPRGAGLGVELDEDRVQHFRRDGGSRRAFSLPEKSGGA